MDEAATVIEPVLPATRLDDLRPSRRDAVRNVVLFSLSITAASALLALGVASVSATRWSLAFVVLRWIIVAALIATPLIHQVARRFGAQWTMPYALRTPATALLLTCESIAFDILSAHFG